MQPQQTITLFGTVSNSATSRISKNGRKYTAFGVAIISDRNLQAFHYTSLPAVGRAAPPEGNSHQASRPGTVPARQYRHSPTPHRNLRATGSSGCTEDHYRGTCGMRLCTSPCGLASLPASPRGGGDAFMRMQRLGVVNPYSKQPVQSSAKGKRIGAHSSLAEATLFCNRDKNCDSDEKEGQPGSVGLPISALLSDWCGGGGLNPLFE